MIIINSLHLKCVYVEFMMSTHTIPLIVNSCVLDVDNGFPRSSQLLSFDIPNSNIVCD